MPQIDVVWVLGLVAAVMGALAVKDLVIARRITPGAKARLMLVAIFAAVIVWLQWMR